MRTRSVGAVLAAFAVTACAPDATTDPFAQPRVGDGGDAPRVIVMTGGDGVNIYHEIFRRGGPIYGDTAPSSVTPSLLAEFGINDDQIIDLTITGNPEADYAADRDRLNRTNVGEPYWIRGTNLIVYPGPSIADSAHFVSNNEVSLSTRWTSDIFLANPEAIVLFVESARPGEVFEDAFFNPVADVYGAPSPNFPIAPDDFQYRYGYQAVTEGGQLLVQSSDQRVPFPHHVDFGPGAWWSIVVGYFDERNTNGRDPRAPPLPDFVADHTLLTPAYCTACQTGYQEENGLGSVATYAAGVLSAVILELRRVLGHSGGIVIRSAARESVLVLGPGGIEFTNWDIRRAMEEVAAVPGLLDYDPTGVLREQSVSIQPSLEQAPWASLGWGLATPLIIDEAVEYLLGTKGVGAAPARIKSVDQCQIMLASMEARIAWSERIRNLLFVPGSQENPSRDALYQRCDAAVPSSVAGPTSDKN